MLAATIPEQSAKRVVTTCGLIGMVAAVSYYTKIGKPKNETNKKRIHKKSMFHRNLCGNGRGKLRLNVVSFAFVSRQSNEI